jgi:hypothetical protein
MHASRAFQGCRRWREDARATTKAGLRRPSRAAGVWLLHAWRSSVVAAGETTVPSRMEQSVDVRGALLQLVHSGSGLLTARDLRDHAGCSSRARLRAVCNVASDRSAAKPSPSTVKGRAGSGAGAVDRSAGVRSWPRSRPVDERTPILPGRTADAHPAHGLAALGRWRVGRPRLGGSVPRSTRELILAVQLG